VPSSGTHRQPQLPSEDAGRRRIPLEVSVTTLGGSIRRNWQTRIKTQGRCQRSAPSPASWAGTLTGCLPAGSRRFVTPSFKDLNISSTTSHLLFEKAAQGKRHQRSFLTNLIYCHFNLLFCDHCLDNHPASVGRKVIFCPARLESFTPKSARFLGSKS